jgi:hypothetical protein
VLIEKQASVSELAFFILKKILFISSDGVSLKPVRRAAHGRANAKKILLAKLYLFQYHSLTSFFIYTYNNLPKNFEF